MMQLINDHFQNRKQYNIPKAQLVIADIPYNIGKNAYGSNPKWYIDGDSSKGESKLAGKEFFDTDKDFRIPEFFHFCSKMVKPEPKETNKAGCMIFNTMPMDRDTETPRIHPTQKPLSLLKSLIEIFTDRGDVVIDPCAGNGSTLLAAEQLGRKAYGFEIKKEFCKAFEEKLNKNIEYELPI